MKKQALKLRNIIKGTGGETLLEGLISVLVFSVLIATITMMIMLSLRITAISTVASSASQNEANAVLMGESEVEVVLISGETEVIGVTMSPDEVVLSFGSENFTIPVTVYSTNSFTAFNP